MRKKISLIFGTRPEAIKLAPVILMLKRDNRFVVDVCVTAQHRSMLDQVLDVFDINPEIDLNIMLPNQSLAEITSNAIVQIDKYLERSKPDLVLVQGDTTTVLVAALSSFYHKIPLGHVEAGLRTHNKYSPFPEEINRVATTHIADLHFAATEVSKSNLLHEGIASEKIFVTGNTVIDALLLAKEKIEKIIPTVPGVPDEILTGINPLIVITGHRRENIGRGFESICKAISRLAIEFNDHRFIYPVHLNPNVCEPVHRILGGYNNIWLIEPLEYLPFVRLMSRSRLVLTDSGGIQEEAPTFGIPVLVMRDTTERPEGIRAGTVKLIGTNADTIVESVRTLLTDPQQYHRMASSINPYGDGNASRRIIQHIAKYLFASGDP